MAAVDAALYEAKRSGKDRIVGYTTRTERVATRMGADGREPVTRQPAAMAAADAPRRAGPAPEPRPAAEPAPAPEPRPAAEPAARDPAGRGAGGPADPAGRAASPAPDPGRGASPPRTRPAAEPAPAPDLVRGPIERRRRRQHRRQPHHRAHHQRRARRRPCARPHRGRRAPCRGRPPRSLSALWGPPNRRYHAGWSHSRSKATQRTPPPRRHRQPPAEGHLPPSDTDRQGGSCDPRRARRGSWRQDPGGVDSAPWTPPGPLSGTPCVSRATNRRGTADARPAMVASAAFSRRPAAGWTQTDGWTCPSGLVPSARPSYGVPGDAIPAPPARLPSRSPRRRPDCRADPRAAGPTAEPIPAPLSTFQRPGVEFGHVPK